VICNRVGSDLTEPHVFLAGLCGQITQFPGLNVHHSFGRFGYWSFLKVEFQLSILTIEAHLTDSVSTVNMSGVRKSHS
jgi:hypothetical protein